MRRFLICAVMVTMFSAPSFAKDNSERIDLPSVKAGSTQLTAGNYEITWAGPGPEVQVSFHQNRKVVCTVPAKLVETSNRNEGVEIYTVGGVETLDKIHLSHATLELEH